ncbi:MAG: NAD-dependent epimerase/dehydratase family protein [Gaiellaceae bacterium]
MRSIRRALVVGGAGFVGSWLVETLLEESIETTVLDRMSTQSREPVAGADVIVEDALQADLPALFDDRQFDVVFHLAGTASVPPSLARPIDDLERNAVTTIAVLEGARHARRSPLVAFSSSAAVYGEGRHMPMTEDHPLEPVSPYGISKLAAETYVRLYAQLYTLPTFSVRPFSLYGPRQRKLVVYDLLCRAADGEDPLVVLGSPEVSRDFVYVADCARALLVLARGAPALGEAYNVASGVGTPLGVLVPAILKAVGSDASVAFTGSVRPGDPLRWEGDPARAQALGATFDTPLEAGLRRTAEWFQTAGRSDRSSVAGVGAKGDR